MAAAIAASTIRCTVILYLPFIVTDVTIVLRYP